MFSKRLIAMAPRAKRCIAASVGLQWAALLANIGLFILIGWFLQSLLAGALDGSLIAALTAAAAAALVLRFACQASAQRMGQKAAAEAKAAIRQAVYGKLIALGPSYREHITTSEALQVSVEGVEHLESYFGSYLPQLFYAVVAPLTLFACLAPLTFPTAVVLLVCVPLIPLSIVAVQKIAKRVMGRYWGSYTDLGALFLESIQGLGTLKVFRADALRHETINRAAETFRRATMRLLMMQLNSITVMDLFAFGGAAAGIIVALLQLAAGQAAFGAVFTAVFLSAEFFLPMRTLGSFFHTAMSGIAAADTMFALLDTPEPPSGTRSIDPAHADIVCCGVGYSYDSERTVLSEVDLHIPLGSFVGITGESGSGKSTLAGIICGSLGRYEGMVRIGGIDLREISRTSLHETITYVPFASYLFEGSVRSNLCLAKPHATDEELWEALQRCRLDGFVRAVGGLDANVAPEGANLSGGQRQRLAMARALLHDTPIYVLDEATSNIDAESEAAIIDVVQQLAATKTVVMITHRLAALRQADAIYAMADGRIDETGTHEQLAAGQGAYARLWSEQAALEEFAQGAADRQGACPPSCDAISCDGAPAMAADSDADASVSEQRSPGSHRSHLSVMCGLVKLTKPLLPVMTLAIVLGVAGFGAAIFLTIFAAYGMLDLVDAPAGMVWGAAAVAVSLCGILRGPLRYGEQLCNHHLAFKILALVRDQLFSAMRTLAPAKLEERGKGDLVSLVTSDVELLEVFYAHTLSPVAIALTVSVGMVVFIAFHSPLLAIYAALAYLIMGVAVPWASSKAAGRHGAQVRQRIGAMSTFVLDSLRGLPEILQFGRAQERLRQLSERTEHLMEVEDPLKRRTALSLASTGLLVMVLDLGMLSLTAALVTHGQLGFAPALLSLTALMSSFGPVMAVAALGSTLQQTLASGARVLDLLDEEPAVHEVTDGACLDGFDGAALRHVDFAYDDEPILNGVDLDIKPGSIVRIAGKSGAGKSTLLKLLMRFWDADNGVVELSGRDIRRINTADLRATEGFMAQDTFLFTGSIRDNLLIARPNANDAELNATLAKVQLADLVERLPQGLSTPVGDLGDSLSGGERQRLGLARVLLHDAPFVLLDEPTSNLDSLNEAAVLRALFENRTGKTIVLVSHRPSAAAIADTVLCVEQPQRAS